MITREGMDWRHWVQLWATHARTPGFARQLNNAMRFARDGASKGRLYLSLSGGKDSVAMAGVLVEAGAAAATSVHAHSGLNLPESLSVCEATIAALPTLPPLDIVEPEEDAWSLLASMPPGRIDSPEMRNLLATKCGSGNLLVQYCYAEGLDGAYVGLRRDESRGRTMNAISRGHLYQSAIDRKWTCCPIQWWSGRDVFAFLVSRRLPIHPFYRRAVEEVGAEDPERLRVDWLFGPQGANEHGATLPIRRLYPAHWSRLIMARPEMADYHQ